MSCDVLILAGGKGTRLRGLWDGPKCLVPVGGVPLLERLFKALPAVTKNGVVSIGHKSDEVMTFLHGRLCGVVLDRELRGTATAVRQCLPSVNAPLMVLNGDTLPLYDLGALLWFHEQRPGAWATAAFTHIAEQWRDVYAGACILSAEAMREIAADERTTDFQAHLIGALYYQVPGFLDVGTPEGFKRALEWQ